MHRRTATVAIASYLLAAFVLPAVHRFQHAHRSVQGTCCHSHDTRSACGASPTAPDCGGQPAADAGTTAQDQPPWSTAHDEHACAICQALQAKQIAAVLLLAVSRRDAFPLARPRQCYRAAVRIPGSASPRGPPRHCA